MNNRSVLITHIFDAENDHFNLLCIEGGVPVVNAKNLTWYAAQELGNNFCRFGTTKYHTPIIGVDISGTNLRDRKL
jgi:hypothetical protein